MCTAPTARVLITCNERTGTSAHLCFRFRHFVKFDTPLFKNPSHHRHAPFLYFQSNPIKIFCEPPYLFLQKVYCSLWKECRQIFINFYIKYKETTIENHLLLERQIRILFIHNLNQGYRCESGILLYKSRLQTFITRGGSNVKRFLKINRTTFSVKNIKCSEKICIKT